MHARRPLFARQSASHRRVYASRPHRHPLHLLTFRAATTSATEGSADVLPARRPASHLPRQTACAARRQRCVAPVAIVRKLSQGTYSYAARHKCRQRRPCVPLITTAQRTASRNRSCAAQPLFRRLGTPAACSRGHCSGGATTAPLSPTTGAAGRPTAGGAACWRRMWASGAGPTVCRLHWHPQAEVRVATEELAL